MTQPVPPASPGETFRVFRTDFNTDPVYVGTFQASNPKEAVKQACYADESGGDHIYEAHVMRNASFFRVKSRDERFIDDAKQMNTQERVEKILARV